MSRFSSFNIFAKIVCFLILTILLVCIFCYQPAKTCYTQIRNTQKASVELSQVESRNEKLKANVDSLKTDQGIEDKAKNDYGYVVKGEGSAHVSGINKEETSKLLEYVDSDKVKAPESPLTDLLDGIFGYDNSEK